jgi:CDGSH iron-sulfur domain-containing protein 3
MSEPRIADKKPAVLEIQPGTYWYCTCGASANQPFCDGSHKGTDFLPRKFEIAESCRVAFCQCKRSADMPRCDGSHRNL